MSGYTMGGANAPMDAPPVDDRMGGVPAGPMRANPSASGLVDKFRSWQQSRRQPDYSSIGLNPEDVTAAAGDTSGYADMGEKRRDSILKFAKEKREQDLSTARSGYYSRSRTGAGGGRGTFQGATYANLVAQRNQLIRQKEYAIPGSDEERDAQSMVDEIDQELLTRRGKPVLRQPTGSTPPSQGDQAVITWLKKNYPTLQNPSPKDILWARGRMSAAPR